MKIGILTLHSQLNYGGVLQCLALLTALKQMGYDARVIDRWPKPDNRDVRGPLAGLPPWPLLLGRLRGCCGSGEISRQRRSQLTQHFLRQHLCLTDWHFHSWQDVTEQAVDIDLAIVGSDQVWYPLPENLKVYMLDGAPAKLRAISYAASFGQKSLPEDLMPTYQQGLRRFERISVREREGQQLVEKAQSLATRVCDPTLLLAANEWRRLLELPTATRNPPRLFCYFLSEKIKKVLPPLSAFARRHRCDVQLYVDNAVAQDFHLLRSLREAVKRALSPVRLMLAAGPREFMEGIANADWIVSDSFHALSFASIFHKNIRILRPQTEFRKMMFSRIEEYAAFAESGDFVSESLPEALSSLTNDPAVAWNRRKLAEFADNSRQWLADAVDACRQPAPCPNPTP